MTSVFAWALGLAAALSAGAARAGTIVALETNAGDVVLRLFDTVAPNTCQNFLNYAGSDRYDLSLFHRSADVYDEYGNYVSEFILQGGGFAWNGTKHDAIVTDPPVANEFHLSNVRGTVAMAKLGGDPDSATSQFFVNLVDNSANLDVQNGGFTVFAEVVGGMELIDWIAALPTYDLSGSFAGEPWAGAMTEVPLYHDGTNYYYLMVIDVLIPEPGDATLDGAVNILDLGILAANYKQAGDKDWTDGDFNDDDTVNILDLGLLASNYKRSGGSGALGGGGQEAIPEPVAAALLALGGLGLARRRRRSS